MFDWVVNYEHASVMLRLSDESWTVTVWDADGAPHAYADDGRDRRWPHGIRALARFTLCCRQFGTDAETTRAEIRAVIRRAVVAVPHACGVDWLPEDRRLVSALAYVERLVHPAGRWRLDA